MMPTPMKIWKSPYLVSKHMSFLLHLVISTKVDYFLFNHQGISFGLLHTARPHNLIVILVMLSFNATRRLDSRLCLGLALIFTLGARGLDVALKQRTGAFEQRKLVLYVAEPFLVALPTSILPLGVDPAGQEREFSGSEAWLVMLLESRFSALHSF